MIDNSKNEYSIFSAYNEGVRRAKGDILCFMHEDILYHTNEWGEKVQLAMRDTVIGVAGVIGSQFLPDKKASWWLCENIQGTILQGEYNKKKEYFSTVSGVEIKEITDVVVVDGLWFVMTRECALNTQFDTNTFNSYHCYDIDICMQVLHLNKRVVVVPDILIEHFSMGNVLSSYYSQLQCFYEKWQKSLPIWRGIDLDDNAAVHMSNMLEKCQEVVCRNVILENSKSYRLGRILLSPFKRILKRINGK